MNLTKIAAKIRADQAALMPIELELLVDPNVAVSLVPGRVLDDLGVQASGEVAVDLGDGEKAVRKVGRVWMDVLGRGAQVRVAWGGPGEEPRLGQEAIAACGLAVDPQTLILRTPRPTGE